MSDTMLFGVLKMPYELTMNDEMSRIQFYQRVQELVARVEAQPEQTFYQPAANEAVEILKSLGYVYEPTYTGLAWVAKKSAQPEQEPVVSLPYHPCTRILIAGLKDLHAWNVLHEWDKARKIVDDGMVATTSPATQRPWVGLTEAEVDRCWNMTPMDTHNSRHMFAYAIESKLKEKNTT